MRPAADFLMRDWRVRPRLNRVCRGTEARHLEPRAMDLLVFLAQAPGRVVSKQEIIDAVWLGHAVADSALSRVVADLRRALEDDARNPRYIETIPKRGYRLIAKVGPTNRGDIDFSRRKRIVVLPFNSLGPPDESQFAAGIVEEITTRLAAASALAVISSQSARSVARSRLSARQIGEELAVDYILEGSVRWDRGRGQQRFRISPQLIRAADDTHLWAESYEGTLENVFAPQIEIAQQVLDHLEVTLQETERSVFLAARTENVEAYRAYLRGLAYTLRPDFWSAESVRIIARSYERATELDPSFTLAHAALAAILAASCWIGLDRSPQSLISAKAALDRAVQLDPALPMVHFARGHLHAARHEYGRAVEALETALDGLPSDSELLRALSVIHRYQGRWRQAVDRGARALDLSPRDARLTTSLGYTYTLLREYDRAEALYRRSLALEPDQMAAYIVTAINRWLLGDLVGARRLLDAMPPADHPSALVIRWQQLLMEGDFRTALECLEGSPLEVAEDYLHLLPKALLAAITLRLIGDLEAAATAFGRARQLLDRRLAHRPDDARVHASLGLALAGLGDAKSAIGHGLRAVELTPLAEDAVSAPIQIENLAAFYLLAGEPGAAFEQIERLLSIPAPFSVDLLLIDPRWAPLADDPRLGLAAARPAGAG